jgi:hypothetical protein
MSRGLVYHFCPPLSFSLIPDVGKLILFCFAVWTRLELATPCVTGRYSNQLNYQTVLKKILNHPHAILGEPLKF